jgi:hypothetical protein
MFCVQTAVQLTCHVLSLGRQDLAPVFSRGNSRLLQISIDGNGRFAE